MDLFRAKGSYVWSKDDETPFLDMVMAFGSTNFGHANDKIIGFVNEAAHIVDNMSPHDFDARNELSSRLISHLPFEALNYSVQYTIGGAKCVESALEVAKVASNKNRIIAFKGSFHGYATSIIGISDTSFFSQAHAKFRQGDVYNIGFPTNDDEVIWTLEIIKKIATEDGSVGTIIIEPAQGLAGFIAAPLSFYTKLQEILDELGLVLIVDDILLGMGRVGSIYSFGGMGLRPDIVLLGKSLAGGYYPLSAIIAKNDLFEQAGVSCTSLDSTFSNNPFGIYIANKILKMIEEDKIFEKIKPESDRFNQMMHTIFNKYKDNIVSMFVMGFAASVRLATNEKAKLILEYCRDDHVLIQLAGLEQDHIRLTPSLLMSLDEINQAEKVITESFDKVFNI